MKIIEITSEDNNGNILSLNMDYYTLCYIEKTQGVCINGWYFDINIIMTEEKIFNLTYDREEKRDEMYEKIKKIFESIDD